MRHSLRFQYDQLIWMHQIKVEPGSLIQHIRIEAFRAQQTDPGCKFLALGDKKLQFALKFGNLALDHGTADHTQFTIHCMKAEIA